MIVSALAAAALLASAQPAPAPPAPDARALHDDIARRDFPAVNAFVEAIGIPEAAERVIDSFWAPATQALIAANPDKPAEARALAAQRRAAELSNYRPLVEFMLDRRALNLLYPDIDRRLAAHAEKVAAEFRDRGEPTPARRTALIAELERIRAAPTAGANADFQALTLLARTPDGVGLRALEREGLYICAAERKRPVEHCAKFQASSVLARLRNQPRGEQLIQLSNAAHLQLNAMIAMGHAAGISLHRLLPPDAIKAAGLQIPPDQSFEELVRGSPAQPATR